jgi:hypothetical protein
MQKKKKKKKKNLIFNITSSGINQFTHTQIKAQKNKSWQTTDKKMIANSIPSSKTQEVKKFIWPIFC